MKELAFIERLLTDVAPYVRDRYAQRHSISIENKSGANDLLTEADVEIQRRLTEAIRDVFPGDAVVAEEAGQHRLPGDRRARMWLIDPIDGTQNFVRGLFPEFGVSIGFAEDGEIRAGGIGMPVAGRLFLAGLGQGATCNGEPIHVSQVHRLDHARIDIDFGYPHQREETLATFGRHIREAGQFRCYCAAIMGLCSVACGETDVYASTETQPWDSAAGTLLIREAGGRVTGFDEEPIDLLNGRTPIIASNGHLHDDALALLERPEAADID